MANPNCCFMIIAGTFFSPANRRGELWICMSNHHYTSNISEYNLGKILSLAISIFVIKIIVKSSGIHFFFQILCAPSQIIGGFQLEFVSISQVINHMTCYKFECSHWLKLQHSDWTANIVKDFF